LGRPVTRRKSFFAETDSRRSQDCIGTVGLHLQLELQNIAVESDASIDIGDSHAAHHRTCDPFCPTSVNVCLQGTPTGEPVLACHVQLRGRKLRFQILPAQFLKSIFR
jgi:hypothetical protein